MIDNERSSDDDGAGPKCPFCGSESECDHHVASFDLTFGEVGGGVLFDNPTLEEWMNMISKAFHSAHNAKRKAPPFFSCKELMRLWRDSRVVDDPDEPIEMFILGVYLFFADLLREAGAIGFDRECGPPCWTSQYCDLFAEDSREVIASCSELLKRHLSHGKRA